MLIATYILYHIQVGLSILFLKFFIFFEIFFIFTIFYPYSSNGILNFVKTVDNSTILWYYIYERALFKLI